MKDATQAAITPAHVPELSRAAELRRRRCRWRLLEKSRAAAHSCRQAQLATPLSKQGTQAPLCIGSSSREQAAHGRGGGTDTVAEGSQLGSYGIGTDTGGVELAAR